MDRSNKLHRAPYLPQYPGFQDYRPGNQRPNLDGRQMGQRGNFPRNMHHQQLAHPAIPGPGVGFRNTIPYVENTVPQFGSRPQKPSGYTRGSNVRQHNPRFQNYNSMQSPPNNQNFEQNAYLAGPSHSPMEEPHWNNVSGVFHQRNTELQNTEVHAKHWDNLQIFHSSRKSISDNTAEITTKTCTQTNDFLWLQNWLQKKKIDDKEGQSCHIALPEAKSSLNNAIAMHYQLKSVVTAMKESEDIDKKQEIFKEAEDLKSRLDDLKKLLEDNQKSLINKAVKCRKRKVRRKSKRRTIYEEKLAAEENRELLHKEIDKWQEGVASKVEAEKREKELKTIADKALFEVRQKTSDVTKSIDVLESLRKLRSVRKDSKERKGLYTAKEDDHMFEARLRMLIEFLQKQLKTYEAEKNMIQVMLDTEQEECQEYENQELERSREETELKLKNSLKHYLFGKESLQNTPSPTDPMYRFFLYYNSADLSLENLLAIRQEWDQFIVNEHSSEGTAVPATWVLPPEPTSEIWASALQ